MDAANILKPALARGELRCIGATTRAEYQQYIQRDPALERRFQPITIEEPSEDATQEMLHSLKSRFEHQHGVTIAPDAILAAVKLSVRYLPDRRLPDKAIDILDEACARAQITQLSVGPGKSATVTVVAETVAAVVGEWTGVPAGQLGEDERARLAGMEAFLTERLVGQNEAVEAVVRAVQRAGVGIKAPGRPVGVLLFVGPTGVGKTELAKATSMFLFGSERALLRLDMSEYMEAHSVSRLVGSPPGYVGHDAEGQLTGALRRRPCAVVLLDEIEKAHPDVLNLFLQVFDDGRLTDTKGRTIDASNALFILTSNIGWSKQSGVGFNVPHEDNGAGNQSAELKATLRPEFLNRIDAIVPFHPLQPEHAVRVVQLMVDALAKRVSEQGITLIATEPALALLGKLGYDPQYGARALRRTIEQYVENPLGGMLLRSDVNVGKTITIDARNERVVLRSEQSADTFDWYSSGR